MLGEITWRGNHWSDGRHQYWQKTCCFCQIIFFSRKDRKNNQFCSERCYWDNREKQNAFVLSEYELDIVHGLLLSDGCITKPAAAKNYQLDHTSTSEAYVDFVAGEVSFRTRKNIRYPRTGKPVFYLRSPNSTTFTALRQSWYPAGHKTVPANLKLTPTVLLHWYLGDGNLDNQKGAIFCTDCFDDGSLQRLAVLLEQSGLKNMVSKRRRIIIPNNSVFEFLSYIGESPIADLAYKWDSIVRSSYNNRSCKCCGDIFNATMNHQQFCCSGCCKKYWFVSHRAELNTKVI